ncbi:acetyltransferase [Streptomyces nanshensis]|uniref:Acetyltransferase n=1 Tax=Streptomyces nanshensis TaxID=518642 RepID=A0A1E7L4L8_9ACTN|nr:GNAT family N-acetyltransferase [Streptomyces nanshensis]OEV11137.1 acetyltransferase [Streptomyces nanshensis]
MDGTVALRTARPEHLPVVAELRWRWWQETGRVPAVSQGEFVRRFVDWARQNADSHRCTVLLRGGTVIGMAWLAITHRVPHPGAVERSSGDVQCVYVVPEERRAGLGGRLIAAVLAQARELGIERLVVHSSDRAIPAYERSGFAVSERLLQNDISRPREAGLP